MKRCSPATRVCECEDQETLTRELLAYRRSGDTILVKASHFMGYAKIVEALTSTSD